MTSPTAPASPSDETAGTGDESGVLVERRQLTDAKEMRALAHPVRVALLEFLSREGPLTATEAGELLGESPANCSFHLRTLAKHGFVEEAPGGTGRQRPWRRVTLGHSFALDNDEAEVSVAAHELARHFESRARQRREAWDATRGSFSKTWRDASFAFDGLTYLTPDELHAVNGEILAIVDRYAERLTDRSTRPEGSGPVSLVASGHPLPRSRRGN